MELEISPQSFISTPRPKRRKKKSILQNRIRTLLSRKKHSKCALRTKKTVKGLKELEKNLPVQSCLNTLNSSEQIFIPTEDIHHKNFDLNETIDLCEDDKPSEISSSIVEIIEDCVVLSEHNKDSSNHKEIIDLTSNSKLPAGSENQEPTIIELSDSEDKRTAENEILVIGTFSNTSSPGTKKRKRKSEPSFIPLSTKSGAEVKSLYPKKSFTQFEPKISCPINKNNNVLCTKNDYQSEYKNLLKRLTKNSNLCDIGSNIYSNSPMRLPSNGLRPIIIDGSNVAYVYTNSYHFSCKRLEICIKYFKEKGHQVTAFVPQFRLQVSRNDNPELLKRLEREGNVVFTPSKRIDGRNVVPYDDRFIVQTAVLKGGVIISRDNYNDLLHENPAWAETIKYRVLAFTWVDDILMFPKDPLGTHGPSLEQFLRF